MAKYSWTQTICHDCWDKRQPEHPSDRALAHGVLEVCAFCGEDTHSGIYVREDPAKVPFPREKE